MRFIHPGLLPVLEAGATVVTEAPLVAAAIQKQFADHQLAQGRRSWRQVPVLSLSAWLQQTWREARFGLNEEVPILLSSAQEQFLWEEAIEKSGVHILDIRATSHAAMAAARFVADWELPLEHASWSEDDETLMFREWLGHVRRLCKEGNWVLGADLTRLTPKWLARIRTVGGVVFAGFSEATPRVRRFASELVSSGTRVEFIESERPASAMFAVKCADAVDEFETAARWARARLEDSPGASIALLAQNLRRNRPLMEQALGEILQPGSVLQPVVGSRQADAIPYHIHCGAPLARNPVIAAAMALIDFTSAMIPAASVSAVLCSPFIPGSSQERIQRALADSELRKLREVELPLGMVQKYTAGCRVLSAAWPRLHRALKQAPSATGAEAAEWTGYWRGVLNAAGWPGDAPLSTLESEAFQQWQKLLADFDGIGITGRRLSKAQADAHLCSLTASDGPSTGDLRSPVQVLEPSEIVALSFDYAWLMGGSELDWPPRLSAPPYIPLALLRAEHVPVATPAGRKQQARRLTRQVQSCANSVVVSYSATDACDSKLSAVFAGAREVSASDLHVWPGATLIEQLQPQLLEEIEDSNAPPLPESAAAAGGTHLLKSQSACPFQAFARWRLNAESLEEGAFSYDARDRGDFLHRALAGVWREIKTSQRLRSLDANQLTAVVGQAIEEALASDPVTTTFRVQLREAERQRLSTLILDWLETEKSRPGDFIARDLEQQSDVQLSGLSLRLRVDRIDELPDGGLVVIDYKSGKVQRTHLDRDRPREPQLLVYAAKHGAKVSGLYFGSVRRDGGGPVGYGRTANFGDKKEVPEEDWDTQLHTWTSRVEALAREFESGFAAVAPEPWGCEFCRIRPVCRIQENRRGAAGEDVE
jgi:probable DNA repair protein